MATPLTATPIPAYTAIPDVPADLQTALNNLEKFAIPRFATTTARDTAITAPVAGQTCFVTTAGIMVYDGTTWVLVPSNNQTSRGTIYIGKGGSNAAYATATETAAQRFTGIALETGRHYRATYNIFSMDTDGGAGATYAAQSSGDIKLRIALGATAGTTGTQVAAYRAGQWGDDSGRSNGANVMGTFTVATAGTYSLAVCINVAGALGNLTRILGPTVLTIEDIGPAITEQSGTNLI
jgi:hypothetical protein